MHNEANQKISMFIDEELEYRESVELLKKIKLDDAVKAKMRRYQIISHVIKTEEYIPLSADFTDKISAQIQQEPVYLLPVTSQPQSNQRKKMYAIAASTIAAVVLVGKAINDQSSTTYPASASSSTVAPQQLAAIPVNKPELKVHANNRQPANARFNDYLRAHNGSIYTSGEVSIQPYARVAAFGKD
jgi:sigma-E factor negative regulatory protein RseA